MGYGVQDTKVHTYGVQDTKHNAWWGMVYRIPKPVPCGPWDMVYITYGVHDTKVNTSIIRCMGHQMHCPVGYSVWDTILFVNAKWDCVQYTRFQGMVYSTPKSYAVEWCGGCYTSVLAEYSVLDGIVALVT